MVVVKIILTAFLFSFTVRASDSILPDVNLTPGDRMPNITIEQLTTKGYANVVNGGARNVSEKEHKEVFIRYFGQIPAKPGAYEVDHLIPLILGGANTISNLWPQSYSGQWGAHTKDRLEVRMMTLLRHDFVSNGHDHATNLLAQFQLEISQNWTNAYIKYVGGGSIKRGLSHLRTGVVK